AAGMPWTSDLICCLGGRLAPDLRELRPELRLRDLGLLQLALLAGHDLGGRLRPEVLTGELALQPPDLRACFLQRPAEAVPLGVEVEDPGERDEDVDGPGDEAGPRPLARRHGVV